MEHIKFVIPLGLLVGCIEEHVSLAVMGNVELMNTLGLYHHTVKFKAVELSEITPGDACSKGEGLRPLLLTLTFRG